MEEKKDPRSRQVACRSKTPCKEKNAALIKAVLENNYQEIEEVISRGEFDTAVHDMTDNPLLLAAKAGDTICLSLLLNAGFDIESTNVGKRTALINAVFYGREKAVKLLIEKGACVNSSSLFAKTPLTIACRQKSPACLKLLLEAGADVELTGAGDRSPLFLAVEKKCYDTAKLLLEHGACVNTAEPRGMTALEVAACNSDIRMVQLLLAYGANIHTSHKKGGSPLFIAIHKRDIMMVKCLLDRCGSVDVVDNVGKTPLMLAAELCFGECVTLLLQKGTTSIDATDLKGFTAIMYSVVYEGGGSSREDILKQLVDHGGSVNAVTNNGVTALILAARNGHHEDFRYLLESGFDKIDSTDSIGYTALMYLLKKSHDRETSAAEYMILSRGACVNTVGHDKKTPLALALENDYSDSFMMNLLDIGVDMSIQENQKCLQRVIYDRRNGILKEMILKGCPPLCFPCSLHKKQSFKSRSPLEVALLSNNWGAFLYLLTNNFLTSDDLQQLSHRFDETLSEFKGCFPASETREQWFSKIVKNLDSLIEPPVKLFAISFVAVSGILVAGGYQREPTGEGCQLSAGCQTPFLEEKQTDGDLKVSKVLKSPEKSIWKENVQHLPLPLYLKQALLFQTPTAFTDSLTRGETFCEESDDHPFCSEMRYRSVIYFCETTDSDFERSFARKFGNTY